VTKRVGEVQENITRVELDNAVSAGIYWQRLGEGFVPIYEEQLSRLERNISMEAWYRMEPMERAMVIAVRRIENASKGHQSEAESAAIKRQTATRGKRH
jgi:hypothetical protein